jgi:Prion-inhibition and propagation
MLADDDPIGLFVSHVGLATLFSACIECFDYFQVGKYIKKDLSYLLIRLDFEKTQLLVWGNGIEILKVEREDRHPWLADRTAFRQVENALKTIRTLLCGADSLHKRYGLETSTEVVNRINDPNNLSANSINLYIAAWRRFCVRFAPERDGFGGIIRTRRAIHDKEKFQDLLKSLSRVLIALWKMEISSNFGSRGICNWF